MTDQPSPSETGAQPAVTLDEIRDIVRAMPGPDLEAGTAIRDRQRHLVKPKGALGELEELAFWLGSWQGRASPDLRHPRVALFAANHGVAAAHPVSAYPTAVTREMVRVIGDGRAAINQICQSIDTDLRLYELDLDRPTEDFTRGPAMGDGACAHAMAYGMMAAEQGLHLLCLGELGIGNTTAASALALAILGGSAADWVGPGTGLDTDGIERKRAVVEAGVEANQALLSDPLDTLRALGGFELAAIAGAIVAARLARIPVVLDGFTCTAAAACLWAIDQRAIDHCLVGHVSAEPGHRRLLDAIGRRPLLDLGMRLGEGTGAALAIPILRAAADCQTGMATFQEAGVGGPV